MVQMAAVLPDGSTEKDIAEFTAELSICIIILPVYLLKLNCKMIILLNGSIENDITEFAAEF